MLIIYIVYLKYLAFGITAISIPIIALIALKIFQRLTIGKCKSVVCLNGKTALVTGASKGIGFETAVILASRGCRVIIADNNDCEEAVKNIKELTNNQNIIAKKLDLASFQSIRKFAKEIIATEERLDILINNAGMVGAKNKVTEDNLNITMQVNHFGPFLLTYLLTDLLKKSAPSRIIFVSSTLAFCNNLKLENLNFNEVKNHPLSFWEAIMLYGNSKVCNIIISNGFAERLKDSGVTCNALHPGVVNTTIFMENAYNVGLSGLFTFIQNTILFMYGKSPYEGAQTTAHLALSRTIKNETGKFFVDCRTFMTPPRSWKPTFCQDIWDDSEKLVGIQQKEKIQ